MTGAVAIGTVATGVLTTEATLGAPDGSMFCN